jgi:alpha-pyrone synthase
MNNQEFTKQEGEWISISSRKFVPTIESIATGTPKNIIPQAEASQFVAKISSLQRNQHRISKIYKNTCIKTRYLAVNLLSEETVAFSRQRNTIEERMQMYEKFALPLAEEVARKALFKASKSKINSNGNCANAAKMEDSIGLIVFVTSTGFIAPGIDAKLIKILGLRPNIARIPVNFMGCAAAMNGIRVASNYVQSNPEQKALVVCLELSSVNAVFEDNINDVIIHSIFGDGCAAVIIGAHEETKLKGQNKLVIRDNFSYLAEDTEDGIVLGVRDNGITCLLSRELPDYIQKNVGKIINNYLANRYLDKNSIDLWAIHPGGTKIIQNAQASLGLRDDQVAASWEILHQYGNMLSCAVLFVLELMISRINNKVTNQQAMTIKSSENDNESLSTRKANVKGIAFSFSPGVGIEGLLFEKY